MDAVALGESEFHRVRISQNQNFTESEFHSVRISQSQNFTEMIS